MSNLYMQAYMQESLFGLVNDVLTRAMVENNFSYEEIAERVSMREDKVRFYLSAPCNMSLSILSDLAGAMNKTVSISLEEKVLAREFSEYSRDEYIIRCANRLMARSGVDSKGAADIAAACYENQLNLEDREFNSPEDDADVEMAHWDDCFILAG